MSNKRTASPHLPADGIAGSSGATGCRVPVLRLLTAAIAASIPADASRVEADAVVPGTPSMWDIGSSCSLRLNSHRVVVVCEECRPRRGGFDSTFGAKSRVFPATFNTLTCLIKESASERCATGSFRLAASTRSVLLNPVQPFDDPTLIDRPGTPIPSYDCNNRHPTCYALVTQVQSRPACKPLAEEEFQKFCDDYEDRRGDYHLGGEIAGFLQKAHKAGWSITPETTKTPACVTHELRTPAAFLHIGRKVAGQTEKAGVMQELCIPTHVVWTRQEAVADAWQQSE
jgi:hypothetical protein